jgi:hypothetical protein
VVTAIAARPLSPFGVELAVDLAAPMTSGQQDELRRLYATHDLLVAHDQRLTMDDQVRVMGYLGPVLHTPDGRGQIRHDNGLYTSALAFHSDLMFSPEPILGISLHGLGVVGMDGPRLLQRVALGTRGIAEQHPELADHYVADRNVEGAGRNRRPPRRSFLLASCYLSRSSWKDTAFEALQSNVPAFFG